MGKCCDLRCLLVFMNTIKHSLFFISMIPLAELHLSLSVNALRCQQHQKCSECCCGGLQWVWKALAVLQEQTCDYVDLPPAPSPAFHCPVLGLSKCFSTIGLLVNVLWGAEFALVSRGTWWQNARSPGLWMMPRWRLLELKKLHLLVALLKLL